MQDDRWRHQRQLQCHVKERFLKHAYGKPLFQKQQKPRHLKQRPDPVVSLKLTNPQDKQGICRENIVHGTPSIHLAELRTQNQQLHQALQQVQQQQSQQQGLVQALSDLPQSLAQTVGSAVLAAVNPARTNPTLVDTKGLGKPPPLKNTESEFVSWARPTKNFVVSVHPGARCLDVGREKNRQQWQKRMQQQKLWCLWTLCECWQINCTQCWWPLWHSAAMFYLGQFPLRPIST